MIFTSKQNENNSGTSYYIDEKPVSETEYFKKLHNYSAGEKVNSLVDAKPDEWDALHRAPEQRAIDRQVGDKDSLVFPYSILELSSGKFAKVDKEYHTYLNQFKWSATKIGNSYYALRQGADKKFIYLHQEILGKLEGKVIDHIDGDGLNNTLDNLRYVNKSQNSFNSYNPKGISKYKGVWHRTDRNKPWVAEIKVEGVKYYLGSFYTEKEAALAYNDDAISLVGIYAKLNEVDND